MPSLDWYLKRARVMTGAELLHRARQAFAVASLRAQCRLGVGIASVSADAARFGFCSAATPQLPPLFLDMERLRATAPALLEGRLQIAGHTWEWSNSRDSWRRAPDTGKFWPDIFFGDIPYLHGNPFGDVRQLWEPSRLQQLVDLAALAQAGGVRDRKRAVLLVEAELKSWVEHNPPLRGPHYISAMECGLRVMAVCHATDMLRTELRASEVWDAVVRIVESHAPLIERRLSLHSSTGNHTVAEAGGLVYSGLLFPELNGSQRRLDLGVDLLGGLAQTQVLPDGGGVEQAPAYHMFNIHILALVESLLRAHGRQPPSVISDAVRRGSHFVLAMDCGGGTLAAIGDSDSGHAISRFFKLSEQRPSAAVFPKNFKHAGYTITEISEEPSARIIFDHGPLGMPPSFGHGHADALSLQMYVGGVPVLIDPGTFTYTGEQEWRQYFRSTKAHNTVTVDELDQARQDGSFMWSKPMQSRVISMQFDDDGSGHMLAEHNGYRDIGIRHARGIAWRMGAWLYVWDTLLGSGKHECALHWHLGIDARILEHGDFAIATPAGGVTMHCRGGVVSLHRGELDPIRGWRSPSYGVLEPCSTLRISFRGPMPHTFATLIRFGGIEPASELDSLEQTWMGDLA